MKSIIIGLLLFVFSSVFSQAILKPGTWRGVFTLSEKKNEIILPFNFDVYNIKGKTVLDVRNAEEKIRVTEITKIKDSVIIRIPVFDSEFRLVLKNDTLTGKWYNYNKKSKNVIPFEAYYNDKTRFITTKNANVDFSGRYEVTFEAGKEDEYKAIGVFKQTGNKLTGTFLTETGDYRYLEGAVQGNNMAMSCFDGSHAFLFFANTSKSSDLADSLSGQAFYGISGIESWTAIRNEKFELKDPESITYVKSPEEKVTFTFPDINKKAVSLSDEKFKDKVVIIQVMGSWCPNCMDETAYLTQVYKQYKNKGLEIVAVAYELTDDFEKAKSGVMRIKKKFNVEYEMLITGLSGKPNASASLPFLNSVSAFPTTIVLDRNHKVKTVYTGFNGPATGKAYEQYKLKMDNLIQQLLLQK